MSKVDMEDRTSSMLGKIDGYVYNIEKVDKSRYVSHSIDRLQHKKLFVLGNNFN